MKFGYFDDANREYVITNPKTPWPWINYLGNEDLGLKAKQIRPYLESAVEPIRVRPVSMRSGRAA